MAWRIMEQRGWKSRSTLYLARNELLHYRLIIITRHGGKHCPTLYALTWNPIDDYKGKLEVSSTKRSPGIWKEIRPLWIPPKRSIKKIGSTHSEHIDTHSELIGSNLS